MKDHEEEWMWLCKQAAQEQDHEQLLQLVQRISELLAAKEKRLQEARLSQSSKRIRLFQIAYDEALLVIREQLLKSLGYDVVSVLGNESAQRVLAKNPGYPVHLFLVGHNAPQESREEMVRWLREYFPDAKILALNPPHQDKLAGADLNFFLNGSEEWVAAIART